MRALALLQLAKGVSAPRIAAMIPLTPQAILKVGHRYQQGGLERASLYVLSRVWFRNAWSWGYGNPKPLLKRCESSEAVIELSEPQYGKRWMVFEGNPKLLSRRYKYQTAVLRR